MKIFIAVLLTVVFCAAIMKTMEQKILEKGYAMGLKDLDDTWAEIYQHGYTDGYSNARTLGNCMYQKGEPI